MPLQGTLGLLAAAGVLGIYLLGLRRALQRKRVRAGVLGPQAQELAEQWRAYSRHLHRQAAGSRDPAWGLALRPLAGGSVPERDGDGVILDAARQMLDYLARTVSFRAYTGLPLHAVAAYSVWQGLQEEGGGEGE